MGAGSIYALAMSAMTVRQAAQLLRRSLPMLPRRSLPMRGGGGATYHTTQISRLDASPREITLTVTLDDDTELSVSCKTGQTLLEAMDQADVTDVWEGGACGGSCSCSTCRVVFSEEWMARLPAPDYDEEDMLESPQ